MYLNYRGILKVIALFFMVIGISMIPSAAVSLIYNEIASARAFLLVTIPLCMVGILILKTVQFMFIGRKQLIEIVTLKNMSAKW